MVAFSFIPFNCVFKVSKPREAKELPGCTLKGYKKLQVTSSLSSLSDHHMTVEQSREAGPDSTSGCGTSSLVEYK